MNIKFQFCRIKRILEANGGDDSSMMWLYLMPLNCTLKNS